MGRIRLQHIFIIIIFFFPLFALSQAYIEGSISDTTNVILPGASVVLKNTDGKIITYATTDVKGYYIIKTEAGNYILEANYLGYKKKSCEVVLINGKKQLQNFKLELSSNELKEIVIEHEKPIALRGDTLSFDAKAFSNGTEVVVEDLLRNIPGITVLNDGTINYNNRPIEKVMIDGDDLFNKGYSILTKNMPNKPLDKVQVLKNYSNNRLLKGIEDSDGIALNLTLQDEYKHLWFGNVEVGYGNKDRYIAEANLMHFAKKYKTFLTTSFNNAGLDKAGKVDAMVSNNVDLESIGQEYRAVKVMNLNIGSSQLGEDRIRFNNAETATLSTIFPLSDKLRLKLIGFLGFDEQSFFQQSISVTDFEGTYFENNEINNSSNKLQRSYLNALLTYDISEKQMLKSSTTLNAGKTKYVNDYTFNNRSTKENLETRNTYFDQKTTYTYKWNDRNVALFKAHFLTDRLPQNYGINDYLLGDLFLYENVNSVGNDIKSSRMYGGFQIDFRSKQKNNDLISFVIGYDHNEDNLMTRFSLFTDTSTINPQDFQSDIFYRVGDLYLLNGYTLKFNNFSINGSVNVHQIFNKFENYYTDNKLSTTQTPFIVNPAVSASWQVAPNDVLSASYSHNINNNSLLQVNNSYLFRSSHSFNKGLGYFNQLDESNAGIDYTTKHYLNRYQFSVGLDYSKQNDVISYSSQLEQNSSLSNAFLMQGGNRISAKFSSHYIVRKLKGTVRFGGNLGRLLYYNQFNESDLRKNILYIQTFTLGWTSNFKSSFNFHFSTQWNFSQVKSDNIFRNTSKYSYLDLKYVINENLNIKLKSEHYNFGGLDSYSNYFFTDLSALYSFDNKNTSIGLDGRNLFNTNTFTSYNISDIGYSTNSYRLLPRYVLLTVKFRF
ncbi:hypothetical protein GN157_13470 [Flavobacterium rakeshii]|uniref:TonB-dependent receptor n=1 Tax=Flavobacterium rakeshii TaxID=1038845 RepID=A0A6N8HGA8_9FLAO|nr:TonB-dependent receptor [Flavobacterium rakeshii]MUV04720.1 hypothetical protein [Flavobacterium rakeshii]